MEMVAFPGSFSDKVVPAFVKKADVHCLPRPSVVARRQEIGPYL
jgi:hypothetical protein